MNEAECQIIHNELLKQMDLRLKPLTTQVETLNANVMMFTKGFPHLDDGLPDFGGHREYHEEKIKAAKAEKDFWLDLKRDLLKKGIVWGIVVAIGLIAIGLQVKLGIIKVGA